MITSGSSVAGDSKIAGDVGIAQRQCATKSGIADDRQISSGYCAGGGNATAEVRIGIGGGDTDGPVREDTTTADL